MSRSDYDAIKEIIDDKLLGDSKVDTCDKCPGHDKKEDPVSTFNKIIAKLRSVLG